MSIVWCRKYVCYADMMKLVEAAPTSVEEALDAVEAIEITEIDLAANATMWTCDLGSCVDGRCKEWGFCLGKDDNDQN
jgi:hypothetical protein